MRFIISVLLVFSCFSLKAHQFLPTQVSFTLVSGQDFVLNSELDVIELIKPHLKSVGAEAADSFLFSDKLGVNFNNLLIDKVRALSEKQISDALSLAKQEVLSGLALNFSGDVFPVEGFNLPPASYVKELLESPAFNTEYRVAGISRGQLPSQGNNFTLQFPESWGVVHLEVVVVGQSLVEAGANSQQIFVNSASQGESVLAQTTHYIYQGILHIVPKGLDHILFVLALFLLSTNLKTLLWQVTAFTVAHSITLILASYGLVNVPANIVEPLIALSIAFVAFENIYHGKLKSWRLVIIFGFGLLHGLGFASVLLDLGLSDRLKALSLISFNVGVEMGQVMVIACALAAVGWFKKETWYRSRIVVPSSAVIAFMGLFWTVERIFA